MLCICCVHFCSFVTNGLIGSRVLKTMEKMWSIDFVWKQPLSCCFSVSVPEPFLIMLSYFPNFRKIYCTIVVHILTLVQKQLPWITVDKFYKFYVLQFILFLTKQWSLCIKFLINLALSVKSNKILKYLSLLDEFSKKKLRTVRLFINF